MEVAIMDKGIQVLLVDDNPVIRELLMKALSPQANVYSFASATEALRRAEKHLPDLIISDYRMPGLSGLELLAKLRISFPQVAVVMMASRADITGPLAGSSPLVEEFIEKPFFIEEAVMRIKRVLDRVTLSRATREGASSTSVRGTLAQMSVVDLLQTLDIGRKSCRLVLAHMGARSEMHFHDGQLVHATMGALIGEAVVYKVAAWTEGSFQIDFERSECPRTITHSTQSVLLEALRLFDESQRDSDAADNSPKPNCSAGFGLVPAAAVGF
jgi:DNA-binding response OmpR family regulator